MKSLLLQNLEQHGATVDEALERFMDDVEMYERYLRKFYTDPSLSLLKEAVRSNDAVQAQKAAHTLKGIAANLGLQPLVEVSMRMLTLFRKGAAQEALALFPAVEQTASNFMIVIKKY